MRIIQGRMYSSCLKSAGEVRSQTRYHFVNGTAPTVEVGAPGDSKDGVANDEREAGSGSGAPAKSAKSNGARQ